MGAAPTKEQTDKEEWMKELIEAMETILTAPAVRQIQRSDTRLTGDTIVITLPTEEFKAAELAFWRAKGYTEESAIANKFREFNDSM